MQRRNLLTSLLAIPLLAMLPVKKQQPTGLADGNYGMVARPGGKLNFVPIPERSIPELRHACYLANGDGHIELAILTIEDQQLTRFISIAAYWPSYNKRDLVGDTTGLLEKGMREVLQKLQTT